MRIFTKTATGIGKSPAYWKIFGVSLIIAALCGINSFGLTNETSLTGRWTFNGENKTIVKDLSGQGHDGRILGIPKWLQNKDGNLLRFDGRNTCIVTDPLAFNAQAGGATLEAWIYPFNSQRGSILSIGGGNWYPYNDLRLMFHNHQRLQCSATRHTTGMTNITGTSADNALPLKRWSHVAAVFQYDSAADRTQLRGYINGTEVIKETVAGVCLPNIPSNAARPFVIGATAWSIYPQHAPSDYFNGVIDEVKVYNRALVAEEIQRQASAQKPSEPTEPALGTLPAGAKLIFQDDFGRETIGTNWTILGGEWRIRDGGLYGIGPNATLTHTGTNPSIANLRLEYTAWSERPCDLTAIFKNSGDKNDSMLFQFGGQNNTISGVSHGKDNLWQTREVTAKPAFRHRVICERWDKLVRLFIDGKLVYSGIDTNAVAALDTVGFYIYSEGFIDNVRIYSLSGSPSDLLMPADSHLEVGEWFGFNDLATNKLPDTITAFSSGKSAVSQTNFPDYEHWLNGKRTVPACVDDGCMELTCPLGAEEHAGIACRFNALTNGFIEAEILAQPAGKDAPGRFQLALSDDDTSHPVALLTTDEAGNFVTVGQTKTNALRNSFLLPNVSLPMRFWFVPNRWYRLRLIFDGAKGTYTVVVLGIYTGHPYNGAFPTAHADWRILGVDIPFARPAKDGKITQALLSTMNGNKLYVDNLYVAGPYNGEQTINGVDYRRPARVILGKPERPRHDPMDMKVFSLRNTPDTAKMASEAYSTYERNKQDFIGGLLTNKYPEIVAAARLYDKLLIAQAFVGAEGKKIERALYYLKASENPECANQREGRAIVASIAQTESALADLYQAYARAYMDGMNAVKMQQAFMPKASALQATLASLQQQANAWLKAANPVEAALAPVDPQERVPYRGRFAHQADKSASFYFSHYCGLLWPDQEALLQLDNCNVISARWGDKPRSRGEYIDRDWFLNRYFTDTRPYICNMRSTRTNASFFVSYGMGGANCNFVAPPWWVRENIDDKDLLFCDENGQGADANTNSTSLKLNYWNPKVKELLRSQTLEIADFFSLGKPGRTMAFYICQEAWHTVGSYATGYNTSAKEAFRAKMRERYGRIGKLNKHWGTNYASFEAIEPPPSVAKSPRTKPTALCYEWELFRQEGYRDWIKIVRAALKEKLPDAPLCSNFAAGAGLFPGYADPIAGFDLTLIYPMFDYFEFHVSKTEVCRTPNRVLTSLRRVFGGGGASIEWGPGSSRDIFDEVDRRNSTKADFFRLAADGRSFFNVWWGLQSGWADQAPWAEPRLSFSVLNYMSPAIPLSITKLRSLERYFLDYPHVAPRINIFESNSSFLNGCPLNGVREGMKVISDRLETAGLDYGVIWENLIDEGQQDLAGSDVIIMPNAITMPKAVQKKMKRWISKGGTLIAIGAPGVYDPWGNPAGQLLEAAFGDVVWTLKEGTWVPEGTLAPAKTGSYADGGAIYRAALGKGKFILFDNESKARAYVNPEHKTAGTASEDPIVKLVKESTTRVFYGVNNAFELTLRENRKKHCWYLTALNSNPYQAAEDEIRFRGPKVVVTDVELPGIKIASRREGDETVFHLRLAPGEGVMLELKPVE